MKNVVHAGTKRPYNSQINSPRISFKTARLETQDMGKDLLCSLDTPVRLGAA